jgi:DNA uptake protein ComE-like DNA-binding protein
MNRPFAYLASTLFVLCIAAAPVSRAHGAPADSTAATTPPPAESTPPAATTAPDAGTSQGGDTKSTTHKAHSTAKKAAPKVDINSASKEDLMKLSGVTEDIAEKIVESRPYKTKAELLSKKIVTKAVYTKIRNKVIAKQEAAAAK